MSATTATRNAKSAKYVEPKLDETENDAEFNEIEADEPENDDEEAEAENDDEEAEAEFDEEAEAEIDDEAEAEIEIEVEVEAVPATTAPKKEVETTFAYVATSTMSTADIALVERSDFSIYSNPPADGYDMKLELAYTTMNAMVGFTKQTCVRNILRFADMLNIQFNIELTNEQVDQCLAAMSLDRQCAEVKIKKTVNKAKAPASTVTSSGKPKQTKEERSAQKLINDAKKAAISAEKKAIAEAKKAAKEIEAAQKKAESAVKKELAALKKAEAEAAKEAKRAEKAAKKATGTTNASVPVVNKPVAEPAPEVSKAKDPKTGLTVFFIQGKEHAYTNKEMSGNPTFMVKYKADGKPKGFDPIN